MRSIPGPPRTESSGLPPEGALLDGKYRLGPTIGHGGMAMVVEARHLGLDERVALKLLLPEFREDPRVVERFLREGRAATKIRSEHVVRIRDVAVTDGCPYLVMEFLDGRDLEVLLKEEGPLKATAAVDYLLQACEAIAEAHAAGIVHRDLKPANLFLTHRADGSPCVKVLDFGISKLSAGVPHVSGLASHATLANTVMGSPHYMSPEQMESAADADARSDIWSLGAILYELIAGRSAFDGESITELCVQIIKGSPTPLAELRKDAPPALDAVVFRCLEKAPAQRYANVAELAGALAGFGTRAAFASAQRISRVLAVSPAAGAELSRGDAGTGRWVAANDAPAGGSRTRRRSAGWFLVALVAVAVAAIGVFGFVGSKRVAPAAARSVELPSMQVAIAASAGAPVPVATPPASATAPSALAPLVTYGSKHRLGPHRSASAPAPTDGPVFAPPPGAEVANPYADNPFAGSGVGVASEPADDGG